jgi:hypothetical protein
MTSNNLRLLALLTAITAVGSGDLLGIKFIKLNKINETQTIGVQICSPLKTWREPSFQSSKLPLPTQTKISPQIHRQKIGVGLMPNEKS